MKLVYKLTNTLNNKCYIGITNRTLEIRWCEHKQRANQNNRNSRLYAAIRKYGEDSFTKEVICFAESDDELRDLEKRYILEYDTYNSGYNSNLGGHGFLHFPEEIRKKISDSQKGKIISEESKKKMSLAKLGDVICSKNFGTYSGKGKESPLARKYLIQFPNGETHTIIGMREFGRTYKVSTSTLKKNGKCKGYVLLSTFNDYPEREYPISIGEMVEAFNEVVI
jgi:group I intron endonuclease